MKAVHVVVKGRVQGVWFRASTQREASQLGVDGWVRNTEDGDVEIHIQGSDQEVEKLVSWCNQGPPGAHVTDLECKDTFYEDGIRGFRIRY